MSIPGVNIAYGTLYDGSRRYGVLEGWHLPRRIHKEIAKYKERHGWPYSSAPWATDPIEWRIEGDRLYLTQVLGPGVLREIFGEDRLPARWLEWMELRRNDRRICRTYETPSSYLHRMETLTLILEEGRILERREDHRLYTVAEPFFRVKGSSALPVERMDAWALRLMLEESREEDLHSLIARFVTLNSPKERLMKSLDTAAIVAAGMSACEDPKKCVGELCEAVCEWVLRPRRFFFYLYGEADFTEALAEGIKDRSLLPPRIVEARPQLEFVRVPGGSDPLLGVMALI